MKIIPLSSDSLEVEFWKYFQSLVGNVDSFALSPDRQVNINKKLNEYFPGLGFGILMNFVDGGKNTQFYITAHGDKSKFQTVERLVKRAPQTDKYAIIALAPPSYLQDNLSFNGRIISTDNIEFTYIRNNYGFDVTFIFPDKPSVKDSEFDLAFQTLLLEFLGELQFAKLGLVEIVGMNMKQSQQTRKLTELYSVLTINNK